MPATTAGHVVSQAYYEAHKDTFGKPAGGVLGTGPFKFVSWSTGNEIDLAKYDGYWDKANGGPYLDTVVFKILPEATTRVAGLQTGEVQALLGTDATPADQLPIVQKMKNVTLDFQDSYLTYFIALNTQVPPFR